MIEMTMKKISILFVVNELRIGGAEKHVISLLNNIDSGRFHISFIYLKENGELLSQIDATKISGDFFCAKVRRKIDVAAIRLIQSTIVRNAVDIVVCTNLYSLLYGWMARTFFLRSRHVHLVEVFHTTELHRWKDKLQMLVYRPVMAACEKVVFVCESQRQYWRTKGLPVRSDTVIYNGIDVVHFRDAGTVDDTLQLRKHYGFAAADYVIGICAALRPEKAHLDLLQAIGLLKQRGVPAKCLIIGDGLERSRIERDVTRLGLQDDVRITGMLGDVRSTVAICNVMALVSHAVETFSIAALEAMALEKPMVMSAVGGAAEQVTPGINGYLYPRGEIHALVEVLDQLKDGNLSKTMGRAARAGVVNRFSLPVMIDKFENLFTALAVHSAKEPSWPRQRNSHHGIN